MKPTLAILVFGEIYNYINYNYMNIVSILLFHSFLFFVRIAIQLYHIEEEKIQDLILLLLFFTTIH